MRKLGKKPRRHDFFLNRYRDWRFSSCPQCSEKTRVRKFPLVIHVEPLSPVALSKSCRYCPPCDLIIVHQDEIETQLTILFSDRDPSIVGNEYLVMGTLDRAIWWTDQHRRTLRALEVSQEGPGTVLRDFQMLLSFVRERELPVSKTYQLPPRKVLPEINARLAHPIELGLKRPRLRS